MSSQSSFRGKGAGLKEAGHPLIVVVECFFRSYFLRLPCQLIHSSLKQTPSVTASNFSRFIFESKWMSVTDMTDSIDPLEIILCLFRFLGESRLSLRDVLNSPNLAASFTVSLLDTKRNNTGVSTHPRITQTSPGSSSQPGQ